MTIGQKTVNKWYNEIKAGLEGVENEPLIQKITDSVLENRQLTIRDSADSVGILFGIHHTSKHTSEAAFSLKNTEYFEILSSSLFCSMN